MTGVLEPEAQFYSGPSATATKAENNKMYTCEKSFDIFIATPMSAYTQPRDYECMRSIILKFYRDFKALNRSGRVFCPAIELPDVAKFDASEHALVEDFRALEESEAFVMFYLPPLPQKPSSVYVEAGMALKGRIPSVYVVRSKADLPYMLRSADEVTMDRLVRKSASKSLAGVPTRPFVKIIEVGDAQNVDSRAIFDWLDDAKKQA